MSKPKTLPIDRAFLLEMLGIELRGLLGQQVKLLYYNETITGQLAYLGEMQFKAHNMIFSLSKVMEIRGKHISLRRW